MILKPSFVSDVGTHAVKGDPPAVFARHSAGGLFQLTVHRAGDDVLLLLSGGTVDGATANVKWRRTQTSKQLLTKVRSFIVTVLSRRLNIRLVLLQPLRHQLISQTEQVPTRI